MLKAATAKSVTGETGLLELPKCIHIGGDCSAKTKRERRQARALTQVGILLSVRQISFLASKYFCARAHFNIA